jgi:hypothetical protein
MLTCLFSIGQIKGTLLDSNSIPVEWATIRNTTGNSSTVSNAKGEFVIKGVIGDSIRIQHLNYGSSIYKVEANNANYILCLKDFNLPEVVVSPNYAFQLFKKSSENTFNRLKDKSISRGYLQYTAVKDNDTLVRQDLDLDIKRQRLNTFDKGERISVIKIQERSVCDSVINEKKGLISKYICPPISRFKWDSFSKSYDYYKVEDSEYIRLYFINKKQPAVNVPRFEVVIQKEDSCLTFIGVYYNGNPRNKAGGVMENVKLTSFMKYDFVDGISFLSETFDRVIFPDPKKKDINCEMTLCYKTYNNGIHNPARRQDGRIVFKNIFDTRRIKNKYFENFWINNSGIDKMNYDFTRLINMKIED